MSESVSRGELLQLRMRAQLLSDRPEEVSATTTESGPGRVAETARRMLAVQGQDWRSAVWALGLRARDASAADVSAAFNERAVVRSWPMRGTIHLLAAEDIGWMQELTNHRVLPGAKKRRDFLGLPDATLDRLVDTSVEALTGGVSLSRDQLSAIWNDAGIDWKSNWRYHVIWWMCQNGITVFGPVAENSDRTVAEPRLVLASEWITTPTRLEGDEALASLAERYAVARGAVTAKDLAWWSGLTAREAKRGLELAVESGVLVSLEVKDADLPSHPPLWAAEKALEASALAVRAEDQWHLLPAFDEHLLGYQLRDAQLDPIHASRLIPGKNGIFLATIVRNGRVIGTWKRGTRKSDGLLADAFPGESFSAGFEQLQLCARAWGEFQGASDMRLTPSDP